MIQYWEDRFGNTIIVTIGSGQVRVEASDQAASLLRDRG